MDRALRSLLAKRSNRASKRPSQLHLDIEVEIAKDGKSVIITGIPDDLIDRLTGFQREVILRRYGRSETYAEIGRAKGVSRQAAHRVHSRAINKIRKKIGDDDGGDG